jgi:hypothetical protein
MKSLRIALAATLLMTGGAASAQSASDARCIVLSNVYAGEAKEANAQKLAEAAFYFYLGRVGPVTSAQLKTLLDAQTKSLTDATAAGIMNGCIKEFQSKVQLVQSLSPQQAAPPKK